jgi:predicted NodU family carbamoyl transferase
MSSKLLKQQLKAISKSEGRTETLLRPEKNLSKKAARKARSKQAVEEDNKGKSTYERNLEYYKQGLTPNLASAAAASAMQTVRPPYHHLAHAWSYRRFYKFGRDPVLANEVAEE